MSVVEELARRLHSLAAERARDAHIERFKVIATAPLAVEQIEGDLVLYAGDPDFEVSHAVRSYGPAVGDVVLVHRGADGDWIATGVVEQGEEG